MNPTVQRLTTTLSARFQATHLEIIDRSAEHRGHRAMRDRSSTSDTDSTHLHIILVSAQFCGMSRVARHRAVYDALAAEFRGILHAAQISAHTPEEWAALPRTI